MANNPLVLVVDDEARFREGAWPGGWPTPNRALGLIPPHQRRTVVVRSRDE
ncbi:MAG: hypothetical protein ABI766_11795 [Gemmatimonadales bacterium]